MGPSSPNNTYHPVFVGVSSRIAGFDPNYLGSHIPVFFFFGPKGVSQTSVTSRIIGIAFRVPIAKPLDDIQLIIGFLKFA